MTNVSNILNYFKIKQQDYDEEAQTLINNTSSDEDNCHIGTHFTTINVFCSSFFTAFVQNTMSSIGLLALTRINFVSPSNILISLAINVWVALTVAKLSCDQHHDIHDVRRTDIVTNTEVKDWVIFDIITKNSYNTESTHILDIQNIVENTPISRQFKKQLHEYLDANSTHEHDPSASMGETYGTHDMHDV